MLESGVRTLVLYTNCCFVVVNKIQACCIMFYLVYFFLIVF